MGKTPRTSQVCSGRDSLRWRAMKTNLLVTMLMGAAIAACNKTEAAADAAPVASAATTTAATATATDTAAATAATVAATAAPVAAPAAPAAVSDTDTTDESAPTTAPPPPAPEAENPGAPPTMGDVWQTGTWHFESNRWAWSRGHWEHAKPGMMLTQARWVQVSGKWERHPARWMKGGPAEHMLPGHPPPPHR